MKVGEALFTKIDHTYPLEFCKLAKELGVKHYGLLSSTGADTKGILLYTRTKGLAERDCTEANP